MYNLVMLYVVVATLFGLIFGSAINALVWRLYVGRSWVHGRSICPECEHVLAPADLIPVVSWLALRGKCRYCRKPIKDHPIVEVITAACFGISSYALIQWVHLSYAQIAVWFVLMIFLIVLAVYDARWFILPDKVMLPLIVVSFGYACCSAIIAHDGRLLIGTLGAAMLAGGAFYALVFFSRGRAMGGGDIKLAFAMGLILGWPNILVAMFLAFNVAAIVGITLLASRKRSRKDQIPFGPYLVAATLIAFWFGSTIIHWYLHLNGLA